MIDSEEERIAGSEGSNWARNKQWDSTTDLEPFVDETVQSRWVLEFLRGVQLGIEEEQFKPEEQPEFEVLSAELSKGAESQLPSGDPGPIIEEELAFGGNVGFSTERCPAEYRRQMVKVTDESLADVRRELWELGLNQLIGTMR